MNKIEMDNNNLYINYCKYILEDKGFFDIPKDERRLVLIDGSNLLYLMANQIENGKFKVNITDIALILNSYFRDTFGNSNFIIDIVLKHMYSFLPETISQKQKVDNVIYSYVRRPIANDIHEGDLSEEDLAMERRNKSYDDAVIFSKLYAYSNFIPKENIILISCDKYADYKSVFRLVKSGYDIHAVEVSHYFTHQDDYLHTQSYLHNFEYNEENTVQDDIEDILKHVRRVSSIPIRKYIYNMLGLSRYVPRASCSPDIPNVLPTP
ncbi:Hypothetical protein ORPV_752 [Orpheovirus IHUMI-LCC2]|uniref:Uncharacterized protein n=1 Tax=Orpheovirus IHUMI-LCC2 TaxID=2023057 RepID=A0A2I2L559_9VIRU|nr:Hypothetical protein ORPV_752 [Orpheovirus IHUMI-LCC2]SNW62656.1 Hypothetical protein ORPV_752 [Orpheovirus IHUMI-LCC2]